MQIGRSGFNVEAVLAMTEQEFVELHKHLSRPEKVYKEILKAHGKPEKKAKSKDNAELG